MKIGLLLPNSRYYPFIGSDLFTAISHYLGDQHQYVVKDVGVGSPKECLQAVKELTLYGGTDILVGFAGYRAITAIKPLVEQTRTPLVLCNAGEHPLLLADKSPYIVHLSLGLFQSVYLACKWAFTNIGKNYAYTGSFFEAGYPVLLSTDIAAKQYGGTIQLVTTTHKDKDPAITKACEQLIEKDSDFIFMGYHGTDAVEMVEYLKSNNLFAQKPIVVPPFFFEPEIMGHGFNSPVITVKTWGQPSEELSQLFESEHQRNASVFATLGFEAAQLLQGCFALGWKRKEPLALFASQHSIVSERGTLHFDTQMNCYINNYSLLVHQCHAHPKLEDMCNGSIIMPNADDDQLLNGFETEQNGWFNTYLCN